MMNPRTKEFEPIDSPENAPPGWAVFTVGHRVTINGTEFAIRKVTKKDIVLRPVKGPA